MTDGDLKGLAFVSDFDGTLFVEKDAGDHGFLEGDLAAIEDFQARGGLFGICTGRAYHMLMVHMSPRVRPDFYIASSGAVILDGDLRVIEEHELPREVMLGIAHRWDGSTVRPLSVSVGGYYHARQDGGFPWVRVVDRYEDIAGAVESMALIFDSVDRASAAREELLGEFAGCVEASQNGPSLDLTVGGCDKGTAVVAVRERLGLRAAGCIGDSFNDVPMIRAGDRGYTFSRSDERVCAQADVVVDTVGQALADFAAWAKGPAAGEVGPTTGGPATGGPTTGGPVPGGPVPGGGLGE